MILQRGWWFQPLVAPLAESLILLGFSLEGFWVVPWKNSCLPQSALVALVPTATLSLLGSGLAMFHGLSQAATTLPLTLPPVKAKPAAWVNRVLAGSGAHRTGTLLFRCILFPHWWLSSLHHVFTNHLWVTKIVNDLKILSGSAYLGSCLSQCFQLCIQPGLSSETPSSSRVEGVRAQEVKASN